MMQGLGIVDVSLEEGMEVVHQGLPLLSIHRLWSAPVAWTSLEMAA